MFFVFLTFFMRIYDTMCFSVISSIFFDWFVECYKKSVFLRRGLSTESGPRSHVSLVTDNTVTIVFI